MADMPETIEECHRFLNDTEMTIEHIRRALDTRAEELMRGKKLRYRIGELYEAALFARKRVDG